MKRREALKHIGVTTGFVVATPSLISLLQSCTSEALAWTPKLFSVDQGLVLKQIVDVFIPKTDTPSASEVNVPEFIDKYVSEVMEIEDQNRIKTAFDALLIQIKTDYNKNLNKVANDNYKNLLDNSLVIDKDKLPKAKDEPLSISDLLNSLKDLTIFAYVNTEIIGETVLEYDPIPTTYYCGDLNELTGGKSWSLN